MPGNRNISVPVFGKVVVTSRTIVVPQLAPALAALALEDELAAAAADAFGQSAVCVTLLPPLDAEALELEELELEDELEEPDELESPELDDPLEADAPAAAPAPAEAETPPTLAAAALEALELAELEEPDELELEAATTNAGLVAATVKATKMETIKYFIYLQLSSHLLKGKCAFYIYSFNQFRL